MVWLCDFRACRHTPHHPRPFPSSSARPGRPRVSPSSRYTQLASRASSTSSRRGRRRLPLTRRRFAGFAPINCDGDAAHVDDTEVARRGSLFTIPTRARSRSQRCPTDHAGRSVAQRDDIFCRWHDESIGWQRSQNHPAFVGLVRDDCARGHARTTAPHSTTCYCPASAR